MADKKPIIGINLDYFGDGITPTHPLLGDIFKAGSGCHAPFARHIINYNFVLAVEQAGGIPLIMPHAFSAMEHYIDMVDGFMFIGGTIDLPPETYGEEPTTETLYIQDQRARFDLELMRRALRTKKPILGICAGAQLLNVVRGGTLHQHIPDSYKESEIEHFQFTKLTEAVHDVHFEAGSVLSKTVNQTVLAVNSSHHMSVKDPGRGIAITARAPDGVAEGIECTEHPYIVGVQWHPEFFRNTCHQKLFERLVTTAQEIKENV